MKVTKEKKAKKKKKPPVKKKLQPPRRFPMQRKMKKGKKKKKKKGKRKKKSPTIVESSEYEMPDEGSVILVNPAVIGLNQDVVCLRLDQEAQKELGCVIGKDLFIDNNWKYVKKDLMKKDIAAKGMFSPFYSVDEMLDISRKKHVLVIFDKNLLAYYLFVSFSPLRHIENLTVKLINSFQWVKRGQQSGIRKVVHFRSTQAKLIARALIKERVTVERTKIRVICWGKLEEMDFRRREFLPVEAKDLVGGYMNNLMRKRPSEISIRVVRVRTDSDDDEEEEEDEDVFDWTWSVRDFNVQSLPRFSKVYVQTFPAGISNKTTQIRFYRLMSTRRLFRIYGRTISIGNTCSESLYWNLKEGGCVNLCADNNGGRRQVHRWECDCVGIIRRIMRYCDPYYFGYHYRGSFEGYPTERSFILFGVEDYESVSCMAWHPIYIDIVAIAHRGYIITEREDYYFGDPGDVEDEVFENEPQPDHEIIEWKITNEKPQKMRLIYSDCEVRHLQYNMDYPTLLAGTNTRGQIIIWDMNIYSVPESTFISYMSSIFSSETVPWIYIPPTITYIAIESCDVYSHRDEIYDMQWAPSTSKMLDSGSIDVSCKVRSGFIVTASGDGTVGVWDLQFVHPNMKEWRHRRRRTFVTFREVPPFYQYDRTMQPIQFVLSFLNDDPVPVTAVSVNNMRQWVVPGIHETKFFRYKSMRIALKRQRPIMHACITAGLVNGQVIGMLPDVVHYEFKKGYECPDFYKDLYLIPEGEGHMEYQCFKHEGMVLCLKRSRFADDLMLSVSQESLCIWKEQSKLYKERLKKMPWYHNIYPTAMHGSPVWPRVWPLWRRKVYRPRDWYMTAEWSPLVPTQFFVLLSNAEVEIYDMRIGNEPVVTMFMGAHAIHHVLPLICTTRVNEIAFIEDETFYFFKMAKPLRTKDPDELGTLKRFAREGAWKRYFYHVWCEKFYKENKEYVISRVAEFQAVIGERRFEYITRVFKFIRLRKAKARKALRPVGEDMYYSIIPAAWWDKHKRRGINRFLQRKKDFMKWDIWEDIIDELTDKELLLFNKLMRPHRCAYLPHERYDVELIDILLAHYIREYFQLYWDIRFEQQHMYDHLYAEDYEEDTAFAYKSDYFSELYITVGPKRQREYGVLFEIDDYYEAERVIDLRTKEHRRTGALVRAVDVLGWESPFMEYMSCVLKRGARKAKAYPTVVHEMEVPDAAPPLNRMWDLWDNLEMGYVMPLIYDEGCPEERRDAIDVTEY